VVENGRASDAVLAEIECVHVRSGYDL
jgi:hypothetical protein